MAKVEGLEVDEATVDRPVPGARERSPLKRKEEARDSRQPRTKPRPKAHRVRLLFNQRYHQSNLRPSPKLHWLLKGGLVSV